MTFSCTIPHQHCAPQHSVLYHPPLLHVFFSFFSPINRVVSRGFIHKYTCVCVCISVYIVLRHFLCFFLLPHSFFRGKTRDAKPRARLGISIQHTQHHCTARARLSLSRRRSSSARGDLLFARLAERGEKCASRASSTQHRHRQSQRDGGAAGAHSQSAAVPGPRERAAVCLAIACAYI